MKILRRNKVLILIVILFILLLAAIVFVTTLLPSYSTSVYGNRLDGIDKVKISTEVRDDIIATIKTQSWVDNASISLDGKIVNVVIRVNDTANKDIAKTIGDTVLSKFTDAEKAFYDFQIFVGTKNDVASDIFPIIGYKSVKSSAFVWSNN